MDHLPELHLTLTFVGAALLLVLLNGFFVAAEFAVVKVRRTRLEELSGQGVAAARISLLLVDQLDEYLSATQLGITLVSLALGWIGEEGFYNLFRILVPTLPQAGPRAYHWVATVTSLSAWRARRELTVAGLCAVRSSPARAWACRVPMSTRSRAPATSRSRVAACSPLPATAFIAATV